MLKIINMAIGLFTLSSIAVAQPVNISIETQYAPNEIDDRDFFSLSIGYHMTDEQRYHLYTNFSYVNFNKTSQPNTERLDQIYVGVGAEYQALISPYIEAGVSAEMLILAIGDIIIDDLTDTDCVERDDCLATGGDFYLTLGARVNFNRHVSIGAFAERISLTHRDTDKRMIFTVTGMNMRVLF